LVRCRRFGDVVELQWAVLDQVLDSEGFGGHDVEGPWILVVLAFLYRAARERALTAKGWKTSISPMRWRVRRMARRSDKRLGPGCTLTNTERRAVGSNALFTPD
jgi:hypothetical protein